MAFSPTEIGQAWHALLGGYRQLESQVAALQARLAVQDQDLPPDPDGHWLNAYWSCLWERYQPVPVGYTQDCPLAPDTIAEALGIWNAVALEVTSGALARFFAEPQIMGDAPSGLSYGLTLFGPTIPPEGTWDWNAPGLYRLGLRTKKYVWDSPQRQIAQEQRRYALANIPLEQNAYGLGGLTHELGHVLHLADHYYRREADGKEGLYADADSLMANPGLVRPTAHDLDDLRAYFGQTLRRTLARQQ